MKRQVAAQSLSALEKCLAAVESEMGVASTPVTSSLFPPQLSAMQQTLSDAFERRNSLSKKTNFDGTCSPFVSGIDWSTDDAFLTSG